MNGFKKTVAFTIILCTLLSSLAGCNDSKDNDLSNIDTTVGETPVVDTEEITFQEEITTNEDIAKNEEVDISSLKPGPFVNWDFADYSIYQHMDGQFYVHIKEWGVYRKIDLSNIIWEYGYGPIMGFNSFSISDDSASIAIYNYNKSYARVSIYHIEKGSLDVKEYSTQFEAFSFYECAELGINMIDEQTTYFFLYGETNPDYELGNSFIKFETSDGGKSWSDPQIISKGYPKYYCEKMEFLTKDFGYCIYGHGDIYSIILTTDGGKTWEHAQITFPFDVNQLPGYIEFIDIKFVDNRYVLTVLVRFASSDTPNYYLEYISTNFTDWVLSEKIEKD